MVTSNKGPVHISEPLNKFTVKMEFVRCVRGRIEIARLMKVTKWENHLDLKVTIWACEGEPNKAKADPHIVIDGARVIILAGLPQHFQKALYDAAD